MTRILTLVLVACFTNSTHAQQFEIAERTLRPAGDDPASLRTYALNLCCAGHQANATEQIQSVLKVDESVETRFIELVIACHDLDSDRVKLASDITKFIRWVAAEVEAGRVRESNAKNMGASLEVLALARFGKDVERVKYWNHLSNYTRLMALNLSRRRRVGTATIQLSKSRQRLDVPVISVEAGMSRLRMAFDTRVLHTYFDTSQLGDISRLTNTLAEEPPTLWSDFDIDFYIGGKLLSVSQKHFFIKLPRYREIQVDGMLGLDVVERFAVTFDTSSEAISFSTVAPIPNQWKHAIRMHKGPTDRYFVSGALNGRHTSFCLDTGSSTRRWQEAPEQTAMSVVTFGELRFTDIEMPKTPVISMEILSRFDWCIDFPNKVLYLNPCE